MSELWTRALVGRHPKKTLLRAVIWAGVTYTLFSGPFRPVRVQGDSMAPTLETGSLRLANMWAYVHDEPKTGDIVIVRIAGRRVMYLKRVLAVPGERIRFDQGALLINGRIRPEPYVIRGGTWTTGEYELKAGEFYIAGDQRAQRIENHATGIVDRDRILGKLWHFSGGLP